MAINASSTTIFCQNIPRICLQGDQSQGYVFDPDSGCFVSQDGSGSAIVSEDGTEIIETINCFSAVADGLTNGFVIPWNAINEQSLVVTLDGLKQQDADYNIASTNTGTIVTLTTVPANGVEIEIFGYQVSDPNRIKRFKAIGVGTQSVYTIPWIANSKQSLIISVDGIIYQDSSYSLTYLSSGATVLTFVNPIADTSMLEIVGIQGFSSSSFKLYTDVGDNVTTDYTIPWYSSTCGSLLITIDGLKIHTDDYTVVANSNIESVVSFNTAPANLASIEIVGITGFIEDLHDVSVVGLNLGLIGESVYSSASEVDGLTTLEFRKLIGGQGITLSSDATAITIDSSGGGGGSFANIGTGAEVLVEPVGTTVEYRTIVQGNGMIITENPDNISIAFDGDSSTLNGLSDTDFARTMTSAGNGESLIKDATASPNSNFELYTIRAGSGIVVTRVNDDIIVADANGGNYVSIVDDYTAELDDAIVGVADTTMPRTITLTHTAIVGPGKTLTIKDESFAASGNPILIQGSSGQTIDGLANISIDVNGGSLSVYSDGSNWHSIEMNTAGGLTAVVDDLTPELGGNLDTNGHSIVSNSGQSIAITPDGSGRIILDGLIWPDSDGSAGYVLTTNGSNILSFQTPGLVGVIDDLSDVDTTTIPPVTDDVLTFNGTQWAPKLTAQYEQVVFRYTAGSGGDLTAVDAVVSSTDHITATVIDGANGIVRFTFSNYKYPPTSIMAYGQDHANNQWNIRDGSSFVGSRAVSIDGSGDADNPDLISDSTGTPPIELQMRQSDTGASANFGERAYLFVRFLMVG